VEKPAKPDQQIPLGLIAQGLRPGERASREVEADDSQ
jgi:hypothetical protein